MPTATEIARVVTNTVKREILSVLQSLHQKIQELEVKVEQQQKTIDLLKHQNESVWVPTVTHEQE